ncbi:hypothetical protein ANO11243_038190 [Dothideomycetidae sp. 11243]|nr:hypothetical protein ANO11243_038190 [fungal sp. No.11243]
MCVFLAYITRPFNQLHYYHISLSSASLELDRAATPSSWLVYQLARSRLPLPSTTISPSTIVNLRCDWTGSPICDDIDPPPSPTSLASAKALIAASLTPTTTLHPSLPPLREPSFSPALTTALTSPPQTSNSAIDAARYVTPSAPTSSSREGWLTALHSAAINEGHLATRATNLALLETYGRNAWLVGNAAQEDVLRDLERDVAAARAEAEQVELERREMLDRGGAEVLELERGWREGVGRLIEVQVAVEKVKRDILDRRREGGSTAGEG